MHVYFFLGFFPACTLLLDTARLFVCQNFYRLHILRYFKIWYGHFYIKFAAYTFYYFKKIIQKGGNFDINLLKSNEKSTTVFILACLQRFFPNFHHAHFKVLQRKFHNARLFHHARLLIFSINSTMHVYFIMHVYQRGQSMQRTKILEITMAGHLSIGLKMVTVGSVQINS